MKTKIKILIVSCVMAAAAVTGFNMAQNSNNMDVSMADIAVMAKADPEEATITCNQSPYTYPGQCWIDVSPWPWYERDCQWSGYQHDFCCYYDFA